MAVSHFCCVGFLWLSDNYMLLGVYVVGVHVVCEMLFLLHGLYVLACVCCVVCRTGRHGRFMSTLYQRIPRRAYV